ncbi:MAG: NlpC/P60 family protein [Desulfocapsaceae bacterium]|nr:NlpC/P60 family protein [Desulfocapsaceae bacterium]
MTLKVSEKMLRCAALWFICSILAGCSGIFKEPVDLLPSAVVKGADATKTRGALDAYYDEWVGTPYRQGGTGHGGLDCSGFVQQAYATLFGVSLPRTTKMQARAGNRITRSELKPTDLVFFKTGLLGRHVGIYNGDGRFMHVSTKKGVSLSRLDDDYWSDNFWQARRIIK